MLNKNDECSWPAFYKQYFSARIPQHAIGQRKNIYIIFGRSLLLLYMSPEATNTHNSSFQLIEYDLLIY